MASRRRKKPRNSNSQPNLQKDESQKSGAGRPPSKAELRKELQEAIEIRQAELMIDLQLDYMNNQAMWGGDFQHYLKNFKTRFKSVVSNEYRKDVNELDLLKMIKKINVEGKK
ncbi:MAG: hypothetical protein F6K40_26270 [Okeania sp. SIO3I5]|uniref:hypothetical protein n=1 Tax=Okeania sp. SIO3I5 TaxID=2607805 RepID=UPI0013BAD807|nr:hypothetical protein [Okeania sp. SIO3I5]NEQ39571.1 hypothetical protein [Okeania sp. SIO3I5]